MYKTIIATLVACSSCFANATITDPIKQAVQNNELRTTKEQKRDIYRHPEETLKFFGVNKHSVIAEVAPGGEWYTNILLGLVKEQGKYIGLNHDPVFYQKRFPDAKKWIASLVNYPEKIKNSPNKYGDKAIGSWVPKQDELPVAKESVDIVFIARTMHNWQSQGRVEEALQQVNQILKPAGTLAIVQHRANESDTRSNTELAKIGRWKQSEMIKAVEQQGFKFIDSSEINSNAKDTKNFEKGVWTLPPTLALKDQDKEKYLAIGESDRMTLKFEKVN